MMAETRPRAFLDIEIDKEACGRMVIELFNDKTPRTCENFRQLCTREYKGITYKGISFHRVIDEFMIQGGDIANGDGTGTLSIYGEDYDDENLRWRQLDATGLVCSANRGKNTNGSQFFITLAPQPHLDGKHTVFGRVVAGGEVLGKIARVTVDQEDVPTVPVLISQCGELHRKHQGRYSQSSRDRGRVRESNELMKSRKPEHKSRRQSDNTIDEGIRGRPRARSGKSTTTSSPVQSSHKSSASPIKKHKRKRSPSPSRQPDRSDDHYEDHRRRRSLPNQYCNDERRARAEDDKKDEIASVKFKGRGLMKYHEPDRL